MELILYIGIMTAIYKIENQATGDLYIGSCFDFVERKRRHLRDLRNNTHHSRYLQRAWNKYGESTFSFDILEECEKEDCILKEQYYFEQLKPKYNMCPVAGRSTGYKHSKATLKKISQSLKGRTPAKANIEANSKKVIMVDKTTNIDLSEFDSLSAACRYLGKTHKFASTISDVCKGRRKTAFGHKWRFK